MLALEKLVDELFQNLQLKKQEISKLEQLDKQITNVIKKQGCLDSFQQNQVSKISAKLLEMYFILEEEYELQIYQAANENVEMQDEANEVSLIFIFKIGKISLETINFCFQMSIKCQDTDLKFSIAQLLDLLVINITYSRKLIDSAQTQQVEELLNQLCSNNQVIFDLLFEELQLSDYLQNLYLCNQVNLLEIKSLSSKTQFSELINDSEEVLNLFNIYPSLNSSIQNTIENILIILFQQAQDCDIKKIDEIIKMFLPISHIFEEIDISYQIHFFKLRLIGALEHEEKQLFEKLEKEYNSIYINNQYDFFILIIYVKKLKIYQEEKNIKQIFQQIEDYLTKYIQITSYEFQQLLSEICGLGVAHFNFALSLLQNYVQFNKDNFIRQNKVQQSFYDAINMICALIDEFFDFKSHKKHIDEVIAGLKIGITMITQLNKLTINLNQFDASTQQLLCQRISKLILEIAQNQNSLKEQTMEYTIEIIQAFQIFLQINNKLNQQNKTLINELGCVGLILAIKIKNQNYISDFKNSINDSLSLLPKLLQQPEQNIEISQVEFQQLLDELIAQNKQCDIVNSEVIINIFVFKNIVLQIENYQSLFYFYDTYLQQNFDKHIQLFQTKLNEKSIDQQIGISLCTPYVKKLQLLKQNISKNVEEALKIIKMIQTIIDKFYKYYQKQDVSLSILILEKERNEIIEVMDSYFQEKTITSDLSISCKFLHFMVLYFCLDIVFDDSKDQTSYFEQEYYDTCQLKLHFYQQSNKINQQQDKFFKNPQFFKSLVLLFSYQVAYYEYQLKQNKTAFIKLESFCKLIEEQELSCLNLIYYESQGANKFIDEKTKNQFYLFQFIFSILQNDISKCLNIIENFYQYYPDSLVLLSQISKVKQNKHLSLIINKKYISYLSLQNYKSKYFSLELILDFVDQLENKESSNSFYIAIKSILNNIIEQSLLQPSQLQTATYILKELISKFKLSDPSHPEIFQLKQIQKKIQWK